MVVDIDKDFYDRADAVIKLANDQLAAVSRGKVSASCMYATARFNAWVSACGHGSAEDLAAAGFAEIADRGIAVFGARFVAAACT